MVINGTISEVIQYTGSLLESYAAYYLMVYSIAKEETLLHSSFFYGIWKSPLSRATFVLSPFLFR